MKFNSNFTPKTYFLIAGTTFAAGLGICYLTYTANGEQQKHLDGLRKELRDEKEVQTELDTAIKKVGEISKQLAHLEKGVPTFAYNATLLKELEKFGKTSKVSILEVKPIIAAPAAKQEGEKKKPFEELNISVKARGTYDDAMRFISALKGFPKVVAVRTFSLMPKNDPLTDALPHPLLDIDMEVRAFLFKEEMKRVKEAVDGDKPTETASKTTPKAKDKVKTNES
jgi:Tfp pilus assembly protein PilO